jgi:hypothetical protein
MLGHIVEECTAIDCEQVYDDMLDECYNLEEVGGPFAYMLPSRVLREIDPIAYRCGCTDYIDSLDTYEVDGQTYYIHDVTKAQEDYIDGLEAELSDLESRIDDLIYEQTERHEDGIDCESSQEEIDEMHQKIDDMQTLIEACKSYQF